MRDGLAATGHDGVVYRIRRDPLRVEGVTPDGEVIEPDQSVPWQSEAEATFWCRENDEMRRA